MKSWFNKHLDVIQIVIALVIAFVAGFDMIGKPARPAILLTVICASLGAGVSIGVFCERKRARKKAGNS